MTDDDDPLLSADQLARYDVPEAPRGFSARVMERIADASGPERTGSRARLWQALAAAAIVVVVGAIAMVGHSSANAAGARVATTRETITLGNRGVAVAEAGTDLRWDVRGGAATIDQPMGVVFYRVERGGPFEVRTPLGTVTVTGTCFSVEVTAMKRDVLKGAVVGAAIATAVVVTVYEGHVAVANPTGKLELAAGEAAVVQPGGAPHARATAVVDPQAALVEARARIAALEGLVHQSHLDETDLKQEDRTRYYAPSAEALRTMADTCWVAFDNPPFSTETDPELVANDLAAAVGITDSERDAINQAYRTLHDRDVDAVRRLYMELTGADAEAASSLSLDALVDEIDAKSAPEDEIAARRHYARERAGLDPTPSSADLAHRPAIERLLRIRATIGNDAETIAAKIVGAARARELRSHDNSPGWHHLVADYGGCNEHF